MVRWDFCRLVRDLTDLCQVGIDVKDKRCDATKALFVDTYMPFNMKNVIIY